MIDLERVLPILDLSSAPSSGIAELIMEILLLQEKLGNPQDQSEFFRWGIDSSKMRLEKLIAQYNSLKDEYNALTLDDILDQRDAQMRKLHVVMNSKHAIFIKIVLRRLAQNRIHLLSEFLRLKSTVSRLPDATELEGNRELTIQLLSRI